MSTATISRPAWWRAPFAASTWRRVLYVLLALPVGIAALALTVIGRPASAGRQQRRLASRLLGVAFDGAPARGASHALASLPLNLAALVVAGYLWLGVILNLFYPIRLEGAESGWGGSTLAGRWAVHALGGVAFLYVATWVTRGLTALQGRLARRLLG